MKREFKHERNLREKKWRSVCFIYESIWNRVCCW